MTSCLENKSTFSPRRPSVPWLRVSNGLASGRYETSAAARRRFVLQANGSAQRSKGNLVASQVKEQRALLALSDILPDVAVQTVAGRSIAGAIAPAAVSRHRSRTELRPTIPVVHGVVCHQC